MREFNLLTNAIILATCTDRERERESARERERHTHTLTYAAACNVQIEIHWMKGMTVVVHASVDSWDFKRRGIQIISIEEVLRAAKTVKRY